MRYLLLLTVSIFPFICFSQNGDSIVPFDKAYKRAYNISKVTDGSKPVIDGKLDEKFWEEECQWSDVFVQIIPYERVVSTSPTRVKLAYDNKNIYVGVWCKNIEPNKINRFIGDRDNNSLGDLISVAFDPYHDFRAALEFNINVGGNKTDLIVTDKLNVNRSWNAVWEGKTNVNYKDSVWTAELAIPFNQLRYNKESNNGIWGLHVRRIIRNNNEVQNWSMIPLKNNGHVFSFGEMHGMNDLPKPRGIEFRPYAMVQFKDEPTVKNNPYNKYNRWGGNGGLDAQVAVGDYTAYATFNPDYGQVELDPSVMNLTAYETFYEEKRPFFLEGKHILDFANGNDMMFYTRRIGDMPSYIPYADNINSFATTNKNVPIIGALKFTGTDRNGVTIGAIQSVTASTYSKVTENDLQRRVMTEPLTNYSIARIQKNWEGKTLLGGMFTSVNRFSMQPHLEDILAKNAFTGGLDFIQYFKNRLYYIESKMMFSSLGGTEEAITNIQKNPVHYFHRESASDYLNVNNSLSSLNGTGGYLKLGRKGNAKLLISESLGWSSPSFDLNDVGYLRETDKVTNETEINYRQTDIWKIFRYNNLILKQANQWDFGGNAVNNNISFHWQTMTTKRRFEAIITEGFVWNKLDTRLLRGGKDMRFDPFFTTYAKFNTDKAKRVTFTLIYDGNHNTDGYNRYNLISPSVSFRIGNHFHISGQVDYAWNRDNLQYVATVKPSDKTSGEYIMGYMEQKTYGLTLKMQYNFTPDISLQFYGSPFTSTAKFNNFKEAANTTSRIYSERFNNIPEQNISLTDNTYHVKDGNEKSYSFRNPDFNFNEFRSNFVLRWEYMKGSTIYLVWEHQMSKRDNLMIPGWGHNINKMFEIPSTNTIMVKVNYWFGI